MKKRILYIILSMLIFNISAINAGDNPWAKSLYTKAGIAGFTFLKISPTARIAGMGNTFTSIADDINAIYINPAGITEAGNYAFNVSDTRWFVNSHFITTAYSMLLGGFSYIGVSFVALMPEKTMERSPTLGDENGLTGRSISMYDYSIGLTYSAKVFEQLSIGIKLKYVNETIMQLSATNLVVDIGTLYYTDFQTIRIAMGLKNFGSDAQYPNKILFHMPTVFSIGVSGEVYGQAKESTLRITLSGEAGYEVDFDQRYQIGTEIWMMNMIALRGGYYFNTGTKDPWGRFDYKGNQYSLGLGGKVGLGNSVITFDFSYTKSDRLFEDPIRFTLGASF